MRTSPWLLLALSACDADEDKDRTPDRDAYADSDADVDADADTDTDTDTAIPTTACTDGDLGSAVPLLHPGSTLDAGDDYASPFCGGAGSADLAFSFVPTFDGRYRFALDAEFDSILALRQGCGAEITCADRVGSGERVIAALSAGELAVVVVDGFEGQEGAFSLTVAEIPETELDCTDGVDDDEDDAVDCADDDCLPLPVCAEICDDDLDDNGNGLVDCVDPVCAGDAACVPACPDEIAPAVAPQVIAGDTIGELDEHTPSCAGSWASERSISLTAPESGEYVIDLLNSDFDTVLVLRGCFGPEIACNDDWWGVRSQIALSMIAGETVIADVDGGGGASGHFELGFALREAAETDCSDGRDLDHDALVDCFDPDCDPSPDCFEDCANALDDDGDRAIDCFDAACADDPVCDLVCPEGALGLPPATGQGNTLGRPDQLSPSCAYSAASDRTWSFVAPTAKTYTFDTAGSDYDTILTVLDGCGGSELACNDDDPNLGLQSEVSVTLAAGQEVIVAVDGYGTSSGSAVVNVN